MRSILVAVLALFAITLPVHAECLMTEAVLIQKVEESGAKAFAASAKATPIILAKLNEIATQRGRPPIKAGKVVLVFGKPRGGEQKAMLGVINAGCLNADAVVILPAPVMLQAIALLGLGAEAFTEWRGA